MFRENRFGCDLVAILGREVRSRIHQMISGSTLYRFAFPRTHSSVFERNFEGVVVFHVGRVGREVWGEMEAMLTALSFQRWGPF
jgi:hypothetical protein